MTITRGKRYWWNVDNYSDRIKSGLFTGSFDPKNGNAILMTKSGETWSIPIEELKEGNRK